MKTVIFALVALAMNACALASTIVCPSPALLKTAVYNGLYSNSNAQGFVLGKNNVVVSTNTKASAEKILSGVVGFMGPYKGKIKIGPSVLTMYFCKYFPAKSQVVWIHVTSN